MAAVGGVLAMLATGCDDETTMPPSGDASLDSAAADAGNIHKDAGDADLSLSDLSTPDADSQADGVKGMDGSKIDGGGKVDSSSVDSSPADGPSGDIKSADSAQPDLMQPDQLLPDQLQPDLFVPDVMQADVMQADVMQPDQQQPDMFVPDVMQPDLVPPDKGIPLVFITTNSPLPAGPVNKVYSVTFTAAGGLGPGSYKWSGSVPAWGTLNTTTGIFSGTPTAPGKYPITVRVDSGPVFHQKNFQIEVASALSLSAAANPFFQAQCSAASQIQIGALFSGGKGPYTCQVYSGNGQGTFPANLKYLASDPTGCTLTGGFDPTKNIPGTYGFMVTVTDSLGQKLDVPVACKNGDCPPTNMIMTPAIWPPQVKSPAAAYKWFMDINDVNVLCKDSGCKQCSTCANIVISISSPFTADPKLDCLKPGIICLYNSKLGIFSTCPSITTWHGEPLVKAHNPQRGAGVPAWNTLEFRITYSGNQLSPCGGKTWACHWETLEQ